MNYTIREKCIFCDNKLTNSYFKNNYENYVAHYAINLDYSEKMMIIPFNIYKCSNCGTVQTKYLGDLNEIYKFNHADSTGKLMLSLHDKVSHFVKKYENNIKNIIEIGSSYGVLADIILNKMVLDYHIIEPYYCGDRNNKIIIDDYYENVNDTTIDANTLIISHVFEHFYNPIEILKKIYINTNIINFFLVFPDLEYYISNNILHVLNTEHTYYVDNDFLIDVFKKYGFALIEKEFYLNHSVIFYFKRITNKITDLTCKNINFSLDKYYNTIFSTVDKFNNNMEIGHKIYLWPASIHSLYLFTFGLKYQLLTGLLDNSQNKIGKKIYGVNTPIYSFKKVIEADDKNTIILINGGVFNNDIIEQTKSCCNIKFIFAL
jgi:hypothetical protein